MNAFPVRGAVAVAAVGLLAACAGPRYAAPAPTTVTITPPSVVITAGRSMTFGRRVSSPFGTDVAWSVREPEGGSVDGNGLYHAPPRPGTYHVQVASVPVPSVHAVAKVSVVPPPMGPITAPDRVEAGASGLVASVPRQAGVTCAWTIEGGTLETRADASQVHFSVGTGPRVLLACRMTNAAGDSLTLSLEVPKVPPVTFRLQRSAVTLTAGRSIRFGYTLTGGLRPTVIWSLPAARSGKVKQDGTYTAPMAPGTYLVRAMPDTAPDQAATITVKVMEAPFGVVFAPKALEPGRQEVEAWVVADVGFKRQWSAEGATLQGDPAADRVRFTPGAVSEVTLSCRLTNEAGDEYVAKLKVAIGTPAS